MKFARVEPPSGVYGGYTLEEWRSERGFAVTIEKFALGQRRVRVWWKEPFWSYPEPVAPET